MGLLRILQKWWYKDDEDWVEVIETQSQKWVLPPRLPHSLRDEEQRRIQVEQQQIQAKKRLEILQKMVIDRFIAKYGNDVKAVDDDGMTLLHIATYSDELHIAPYSEENYDEFGVGVIKYLISEGADVNAKDDNGDTPLDLAREEEQCAREISIAVHQESWCATCWIHASKDAKRRTKVVEYLESIGAKTGR